MAEQKKGGKPTDIKSVFSVQITAGRATPQPPLGPILGQNGIQPAEFCNQFNDITRDMGSDVLPVVVTVLNNGTFKLKIKQPTVASMLMKAAGVTKGSANPRKDKVGKINMTQVQQIAERKMPDLNTEDSEAAARIVIGTAKSLGIEIN